MERRLMRIYFLITTIAMMISGSASSHEFVRDNNIYTNPNFIINLNEVIQRSEDLNWCAKDILLAEKIYTSIENGVTLDEFINTILVEVDDLARSAKATYNRYVYEQREHAARQIYNQIHQSTIESFRSNFRINEYTASQFVMCLKSNKLINFADRIIQ